MLIIFVLFFLSVFLDATTTIIGIQKYGFREANKFACWYHRWRHGKAAGDKGQSPKAWHTIELSMVQVVLVLGIVLLINRFSADGGYVILITASFAEFIYVILNLVQMWRYKKK